MVHDPTQTVSVVQCFEGIVQFFKGELVCHIFLDHDLAIHVIFNELWHWLPALVTTKCSTFPYTSSNQLEWSSANLLTRSCHANNNRLAPALMTALQCCAHYFHVTNALKAVVNATVSQFNNYLLYWFVWMVIRINEFITAKRFCCFELARISVNANDARCTCNFCSLCTSQTNGSKTKTKCKTLVTTKYTLRTWQPWIPIPLLQYWTLHQAQW